MSEEIRTADANLHALHAERAALRLAAQTAGIVVWLDGDTYHASLNDAEATGATLGAAIVALCARVAEREVTTRADLDTLRNGVAWLGGELARAKAWARVWKRAAKGQWNRAELMYRLLYTLGLRIGEVLPLRRIDFAEDWSTVTIERAIAYRSADMDTPKSTSAVRVLPVPARLQADLREHWTKIKAIIESDARWKEHGLLFPSEAGTPISPRNFERAWSGQVKKPHGKNIEGKEAHYVPGFREHAGLPGKTVLHDLRGFVATQLEDLSIGQRTIKHILGHKAGNVTELYIKRHMPTMRRAIEQLDAVLAAGSQPQEQAA